MISFSRSYTFCAFCGFSSDTAASASSRFWQVACPITETSRTTVASAKSGFPSTLLSKRFAIFFASLPSSSSSVSSVPGTSLPETQTSFSANGSSTTVQVILNTVWKMEMSTLLIVDAPHAGKIKNSTYMIMPNSTAPMTLKERWMTDARFPFLPEPTPDKSAVTQVPIFCPSVINTADFQLTMPFIASVCKMPTEAEELWMIAVTTVPVRIASSGFLPSTVNALEKIGESR